MPSDKCQHLFGACPPLKKGLQGVHTRDRDDRKCQLELQVVGVDMVEPVRLRYRGILEVTRSHKERIPRQSHHPHELGYHGHVDEFENLDDEIHLAHASHLGGKHHQFARKLEQDETHDHRKTNVKQRHDAAERIQGRTHGLER